MHSQPTQRTPLMLFVFRYSLLSVSLNMFVSLSGRKGAFFSLWDTLPSPPAPLHCLRSLNAQPAYLSGTFVAQAPHWESSARAYPFTPPVHASPSPASLSVPTSALLPSSTIVGVLRTE